MLFGGGFKSGVEPAGYRAEVDLVTVGAGGQMKWSTAKLAQVRLCLSVPLLLSLSCSFFSLCLSCSLAHVRRLAVSLSVSLSPSLTVSVSIFVSLSHFVYLSCARGECDWQLRQAATALSLLEAKSTRPTTTARASTLAKSLIVAIDIMFYV